MKKLESTGLSPSKIICVAKNYRAHAAEMHGEVPSEPMLFFKPPSSLLESGGTVELPDGVERVDFEAELGIVIGQRARRVTREAASAHVRGYTAVCDITARDYQKTDKLWTRAKGMDGFCPAGPEIVAGMPPSDAAVRLWQNDELRQDGHIEQMVFDIPTLIEFASGFMTLEPGDLIATGTPVGVGPLSSGDRIRIEVGECAPLTFSVG